MARRPLRTAYAAQLKEAIEHVCPAALFQDLKVHGNTVWTPLRLLACSVLMSWHDAQTLTSRFENVRELLARMFVGWIPPASYTGYAQALARWIEPLLALLKPRLQQRVR